MVHILWWHGVAMEWQNSYNWAIRYSDSILHTGITFVWFIYISKCANENFKSQIDIAWHTKKLKRTIFVLLSVHHIWPWLFPSFGKMKNFFKCLQKSITSKKVHSFCWSQWASSIQHNHFSNPQKVVNVHWIQNSHPGCSYIFLQKTNI